MKACVVELPREARPLFEGERVQCLAFIRRKTALTRLGLVVEAPPPVAGPDAVVCVPADVVGDWEARATEAIAAWESRWLLIDSAPRRHRDEVRADLHHVIAIALIAAAITGADRNGRPIDDDF
ncbi:hypothetical protein [Lichenibacterium ramalinae]|uniref:Uncharacterized protein n=1 Tax=Lichenibacterium ramalinae TaxID=2316527 RepID=A0A4Q2RB49_9HYPH|nr:hypothetical protein [Lichenibacterium ramalinae]RYB02128.1 hypothetical protein D3272_22670 [Lichenibacterium ramalinae]